MLVSHKHKFIFIKTIKTAGTSTEIFLEPYCISGLKECHTREMLKTEEGIVGSRFVQSRAESYEFYNHMTPKKIKQKLGEEIFDNYTKITNIRNPFDILVSHYYFKPTFRLYCGGGNFTFEDYLLKTKVVSDLALKYKELLFLDEKFIIDEIIRYETLSQDLDNLLIKLNLGEPERNLSNYKESLRRKGIPYTNFYTQETKQLVEKHFQFYLDLFDYKF